MDVIGLVLEILLALAGPVARQRSSQRRRQRYDDLRALLNNAYGTASSWDARVTAALRDDEFGQRDSIEMAQFLNSEYGFFATRRVVVAVLSYADLDARQKLVQQLTTELVAALRLFRGSARPEDQAMATTLFAVLQAATSDVWQVVQRDDVLVSYARGVIDRERENLRLNPPYKDELLAELLDLDPASVLDRVLAYAAEVAAVTETVELHSTETNLRVPIEQAVVIPEVWSRDGRSLRQVEVNPLLGILDFSTRTVVLGEPGAGKSTLVQLATRALALAAADGDTLAVPIRVELRHLVHRMRRDRDRPVELVQFLCDWMCGAPDGDVQVQSRLNRKDLLFLLQTGRAVLLLDGLDEVLVASERRRVVSAIDELCRVFPSAAVVVSSRTVGYDEIPLSSGFEAVVVQPFDHARVSLYVERFLANFGQRQPVPERLSANAFMSETERIDDLRRSPLLLGVLCNLYARGRSMPRSRVELYEQCAGMLFDLWDLAVKDLHIEDEPRYGGEELTRSMRSAVLQLAYRVFRSGSEEFDGRWLKGMLLEYYREEEGGTPSQAEVFADAAISRWRGRQWLLTFVGERDGADWYRFAHRTFMEHFAARQAVYLAADGEAMWREIAESSTRSATEYCLLTAQFSAEIGVARSDQLVTTALAQSRTQYEQSQGQGNQAKQAWHIACFCIEASAGVRLKPELRGAAFTWYLSILGRSIPWLSTEEVLRDRYPTPELVDVFTGDTVDESDEDFESAVHLVEAAYGVSVLQYYSTVELQVVLRAALNFLVDVRAGALLTFSDRLRLCAFLRLYPYLDGSGPLPSNLTHAVVEMAEGAWSELGEMLTADEHDLDPDPWLLLALHREQRIVNEVWVSSLMPVGLFLGGWPYPVNAPAVGTVAHQLVLALCGLRAPWQPQACLWTADQIDRILRIDALRSWSTDATANHLRQHWLDYFEAAPVIPLAQGVRTKAPLSPTETPLLTRLLDELSHAGDTQFLRALAVTEDLRPGVGALVQEAISKAPPT